MMSSMPHPKSVTNRICHSPASNRIATSTVALFLSSLLPFPALSPPAPFSTSSALLRPPPPSSHPQQTAAARPGAATLHGPAACLNSWLTYDVIPSHRGLCNKMAARRGPVGRRTVGFRSPPAAQGGEYVDERGLIGRRDVLWKWREGVKWWD